MFVVPPLGGRCSDSERFRLKAGLRTSTDLKVDELFHAALERVRYSLLAAFLAEVRVNGVQLRPKLSRCDGRAITYIDMRGGVSNIWSQPLDEGSPKQLTDFKTGRLFSFDWSKDDNHLALVRGAETSD